MWEVATGISCGVDSFYNVLKHLDSEYSSRRLTHVCIYNNGSINNCYGKENIPFINQKVFEHAEVVAKELNLPLLKLESNFQDVVPQNHLRTHTYMDALPIYALQKLWRVYYYGSSNSYAGFSLKNNLSVAPGRFEPFLLDCFSTSKFKIISSGSEGDRNDKIEFISDKLIAQKYLHVCLKKDTNCGWCSKCLRTLLALDAAGKLDNFRESFNVDGYIKNRGKALVYLYNEIKKNPESPFSPRRIKFCTNVIKNSSTSRRANRNKFLASITVVSYKFPLLYRVTLELNNNLFAQILAKLEYFNPADSIKDRIAWAMIDRTEHEGKLKSDFVVIEPTGNELPSPCPKP